jgi:uncharacterized protein (TIGR03118 family)
MRISRLAYLVFPMSLLLACSSNDNKAQIDARTDTATGDHPTDLASNDASNNDTAADAPVDVVTPNDAPDAGVDTSVPTDAAVDVHVPKLVHTILVMDQAPDGGSDAAADGGSDAGGADGPTAPTIDPDLVNPWGLAFNPTGPVWVADNHSGLSTIYNAQGQKQALVVTIPTAAGGTPPSAPTGLVFNVTTGFMGDHFIFSSEDGTITGWATGTAAVMRSDNSTAGAVYKGLALGIRNNIPRLYATDFHNGKVDVFDQGYAKITTTGGFADANLPAGFAPFGVQASGPVVYVTYAKQDADKMDDTAGAGNGFVDVFDFDGVLTKRLISGGALNSPWAIAMAPADFGPLSHDLLVGNFGDGHINAYDPSTGASLGPVVDSPGVPLAIPGLWALVFGNDTPGAAHNQLFFTAGPGMEMHGLLGRLDFVP